MSGLLAFVSAPQQVLQDNTHYSPKMEDQATRIRSSFSCTAQESEPMSQGTEVARESELGKGKWPLLVSVPAAEPC